MQNETASECLFSTRKEWAFKDHAFMGATHALSGIAVFLMLVAFLPQYVYAAIGTSVIWVIVLMAITTAGAALLPDLDNTSSTARNSLGPLGIGLSYIFRGSSTFLQTTIRTKRDDPSPNPHRGAWHTIPLSLLLGFLVYLGTQIGGDIKLPFVGDVTGGYIFALGVSFLLTHLALSGLAKSAMKKIKKSSAIGEFIALLVSFSLNLAIFINIPTETSFWWLGVSVALGCIVHILGDAFTTAGVPLLFPLSAFIKGKFWWTTRFTTIKAGGVVEQYLFLPGFAILIVVALIKISIDTFQ